MKICIHTPYGASGAESSLLYLIARAQREQGVEVRQLRCNGVFSICDRDPQDSYRRPVNACLDCQQDQQCGATWAGIQADDLSRRLTPEMVENTRQLFAVLEDRDVEGLRLHDVPLSDLWRASFERVCRTSQVDGKNKRHNQIARRLALSTLRMASAAEVFIRQAAPDIVMVAEATDYITRALRMQCERHRVAVVTCRWDMHRRTTTLRHSLSGETFECPIVFTDITALRNDLATWPIEVREVLREIQSFITPRHIAAPLSAVG